MCGRWTAATKSATCGGHYCVITAVARTDVKGVYFEMACLLRSVAQRMRAAETADKRAPEVRKPRGHVAVGRDIGCVPHRRTGSPAGPGRVVLYAVRPAAAWAVAGPAALQKARRTRTAVLRGGGTTAAAYVRRRRRRRCLSRPPVLGTLRSAAHSSTSRRRCRGRHVAVWPQQRHGQTLCSVAAVAAVVACLAHDNDT